MKNFVRPFFILLLLLTVTGPIVFAQENTDLQNYDSLTLALYNQARWDELIVAGNKAIEAGLDHYYIQMRMGIAYYELENYRRAIGYFEQANALYPVSQTAIEYLYYSYLFSGRDYDAGRMAEKLSDERKKKIGLNQKNPVELVYVETGPGIGFNDEIENLWDERLQNVDSIYSKSYFYHRLYYTHAGLKLRLHPSISTYQGYNYVDADFTQKLSYLNTAWTDYFGKINQHEYYGNLALAIPDGIRVTAAWHLLWTNFENRYDYYDTTLNVVLSDTITTHEDEALFSLSVRKDIGLFAVEGMASYGDFTRTKIKQAGLLFYSFPFGNLDLYTETGIFRIWDNRSRDNFIFHQMIGVKVLPALWFEGQATIGNLKDFNERMAFIIYNTSDKINYKIEGNIIYDISKRLEVSLRGRYMERVTKYWYYTDFSTSEELDLTFGYLTLIGGIKWKL
jgi:hypothetical protein